MALASPLSDTTILAGAGISVEAGLPDAMSWLNHLLDELTISSKASPEVKLAKSLCRLDAHPERRIRFEVAIGWIMELYSSAGDLLEFFDTYCLPDRLHCRLAAAACGGATISTVNFDDLIERAIFAMKRSSFTVDVNHPTGSPPPGTVSVFKLHGTRRIWNGTSSVVASRDHEPLITAAGISRASPRLKLNNTSRDWLHNEIDGRTLLIIGYSGADDLDIVPALYEVTPSSCVWIDYEDKPPRDVTTEWLINQSDEKQRLINYYRSVGTDISAVRGRAHDTLDMLRIPGTASTDPVSPDWRASLSRGSAVHAP